MYSGSNTSINGHANLDLRRFAWLDEIDDKEDNDAELSLIGTLLLSLL